MVASTGRRGGAPRGGRSREAGPADSARSLVLVVAPSPAEAALLLAEARGAVHVTALCLTGGDAEGRSAFARAASAVGHRGGRADDEARVLPSGADAASAVLAEMRVLGPGRVLTTGADQGPGDPDGSHEAAALAVFHAVEAYHRETGRPVFVDCRTLDPHAPAGFGARPRYRLPVNWLVRGNDGRLSAYLPTAGAVLRWTERADGGWAGPELLDAPGLLPGLTVAQGPDGYVRLVGLRRTERADGTVATEVVCATQYQTGRPLSPWHELGNPHRAEPERGRFVGLPVAAFDDDGTVHVFVRNDEHTVNTRHQGGDGVWSPWRHLRGTKTADEMVAMRAPDGTAELFARLRDTSGVARWSRTAKNVWAEDLSPNVHAYPGTLAAAPEAGALRYTYAETGELCQWQWGAYGPTALHGPDVAARVAGITGVDLDGWLCTVLASTDRRGCCLVGFHVEGRHDSGVWWTATDQWCLVPPAVAPDRHGRVTVAALDASARLTTTRRAEDERGLALGPWRQGARA
ncbi:hypothetical protein ACFUJY_05010 [Streptomyces sp. NPDC057249]|uniref:hypothetical protein n=1 Tax=Streptomyces sp. NPDC057249 TaxID=3346067 RepID=UPI00363B7C8E